MDQPGTRQHLTNIYTMAIVASRYLFIVLHNKELQPMCRWHGENKKFKTQPLTL